MLRPERMVKIRLLCTKGIAYDLIAFLHERGILHLTKSIVKNGIEKQGPLPFYDALIKGINEISIIADYYNFKNRFEEFKHINIRTALSIIEKEKEKIEKLKLAVQRIKEIEKEIASMTNEINNLTQIEDLLSYDEMPKSLSCYVIKVEENKNVDKINNLLKNALAYEKKGKFIIVIVKSNQSIDFQAIKMPEKNPKKRIEELRPNIKILSKEKQTLIEMLNNEKEKIKDLYYSLLLEKDRAEISRFFSGTKSIYIIEGWVPHNDYEALKNDILSKFENNVLIEEISDMEHGHSDFPPTLIKSPKTIKNYELAYSFSSLPRGDEFNAAFFYFLTFPIFYGMIIGDVGYSLISIIIALLIKNLFKSSKMLNNICNIWLFSSLAGIAWGLIFDEWFGSSHVFWLEKLKSYGLIKEANAYYQGLSRLHNFNDLLFLCIILGTSHVMLGYLLSIINAYMHKDKKHMLASTGWFLGFSSIITYALTSNVLMSALIFVSGVVLVLLNEGLFGLMELPSFFSVPASYLRIAAIGIAGVIIAEIINTGLPSELNLINIFILLILLLLHIFNAFIAMFESTIQAGRLQILEFGLRFNKGGGYEYKPFMLKRGEKYGS